MSPSHCRRDVAPSPCRRYISPLLCGRDVARSAAWSKFLPYSALERCFLLMKYFSHSFFRRDMATSLCRWGTVNPNSAGGKMLPHSAGVVHFTLTLQKGCAYLTPQDVPWILTLHEGRSFLTLKVWYTEFSLYEREEAPSLCRWCTFHPYSAEGMWLLHSTEGTFPHQSAGVISSPLLLEEHLPMFHLSDFPHNLQHFPCSLQEELFYLLYRRVVASTLHIFMYAEKNMHSAMKEKSDRLFNCHLIVYMHVCL